MTPNTILTRAVISAVTDSHFETEKSYCCRFVREVVESVYIGGTFDSEFADTARLTGLNFIHAGLGFRYRGEDLVVGDILFKIPDAGKFGHVGIYVDRVPGHDTRHLVGENSSTPIGRIQGAKGFRSLEEWGHISAVVRLPLPQGTSQIVDAAKEPRLVVARAFQGRWMYTAVSSAVYDGTTGYFTVNQAQLGGVFQKNLQSARVSVRKACAAIGVTIDEAATAGGNKLNDANDPRQYVFVG